LEQSGEECFNREHKAEKKIIKECFLESTQLKAVIREQQGKNWTPTEEGLSPKRLGLLTFVGTFYLDWYSIL